MTHEYWHAGGRDAAFTALRTEPMWDVLIVGGGITGAGILRECTRRGLRALLVERQDFAWGTSSRSSKMVHGGLRYLGAGQFKLTHDSVLERQRLLNEAPGLINPLHFFMAHYRRTFPGPGIFGLLLTIYDVMAGKRNHGYHAGRSALDVAPGIRADRLVGGTRFGDAVTDDARLVLRVLHEAVAEGGTALNYVEATDILRGADGQVSGAKLTDQESGHTVQVNARVVINATGVWTDELRKQLGADAVIRPLRGSHVVVPFWRLPVAFAVSFFHPQDKRPVFVFPWEGMSVIGTTDLDHRDELKHEPAIVQEEVDYLLTAANAQFPDAAIAERDVVATWSGVRPVIGTGALNPSKEKREHVIWDDHGLISVAGGKLTTFRLIALDVLEKARARLPMLSDSPADAVIFKHVIPTPHAPASLSLEQRQRLAGRYGSAATRVLSSRPESLTRIGTTDTLWAELVLTAREECVVHLDDLLLRRTRIGLLLPQGGRNVLPYVRELVQPILRWSDAHWDAEVARYLTIYQRHYSLPGGASA